MSLAREIIDRIFFPNRDPHAVPVLDGGFSPNTRLDDAKVEARFDMPDSLAVGAGGDLFVSAGREIFRLRGGPSAEPERFAAFDTKVGALAFGTGRLYAALAGTGVVALDEDGRETSRLTAVKDVPLHCVTAIAAAGDGSVLLTDGSQHNGPDDWLRDLMEKRPGSGRVVTCGADLGGAAVLEDELNWPSGIAADGDRVLVTEAWAHRLLSIPRDGGRIQVVVKNFAGYPARIHPSVAGGYWIAFFAMRTQLTEFVLREDRFRINMMRQIEPELWIGPTLGNHFDYREPTQVGRIKKLGIQKPWAPPRSYGLAARINAAGEAVESLHSRVSGEVHGVTDLVEVGGRLLVASKGHGKLVSAPIHGAGAVIGRNGS